MSEPSAVPPYDLDFRPSSYWDLADATDAIIRDVKGHRRRVVVRMQLETGVAYYPEEWGEAMLSPTLPPRLLQHLLAVDESWIGGERLPDCLPGEVEIARVTLQNRTHTVFSIRARRGGNAIRFRMLSDDDVRPWNIAPASAPGTLSLAQLRDLIVSASHPAWPDDGRPLDHRLRDGVSRPRARLFVIVQSACYPDLSGLFDDRAREWVEGQAAPGGSDA